MAEIRVKTIQDDIDYLTADEIKRLLRDIELDLAGFLTDGWRQKWYDALVRRYDKYPN